MSAASIVATVFDVLGLAIAAYGFRRTWLDHARGERFIPASVRSAFDAATRTLGRPRVVTGQLGIAFESSGVASAHVFAREPLPDIATDPVAFRETLERQLDRFQAEALDVRRTFSRQLSELKDDVQHRADAATQEIERVEALTHRVAVDGLRWEVVGWFLILTGTVIGAFA